MSAPFIQTSFSWGEIAPSLWGHVDIARWHAACATLRNCFVGFRGGVDSRGGFAFVGYSKQNPNIGDFAPRLVPFRFNLNQQFPLEFGDHYIRFISRGGYVTETALAVTAMSNTAACQLTVPGNAFAVGDWLHLTGLCAALDGQTVQASAVAGNLVTIAEFDAAALDSTTFGVATAGTAARIYTLPSPYLASDLPLLKWTQSADAMTLVHPNYPPYQLSRLGPTNWTLTQASFGSGIAAPATCTAVATTHPSGASSPPTLPTAYAYCVTAIDPKTGQESVASPIADVLDSVDIAATAGSIVITWGTVAGAHHYNVYKAPASYNTDPGNASQALPVPKGALFGLVGSAFGNQFVDSNITADVSIAPPQHKNPLSPGQILSITMAASSNDWTFASCAIPSATGSGFAGSPVIVNKAIVAVIVDNPGQFYSAGDGITFAGDGTSAMGTPQIGPQDGTWPGVVAYFQQRRFYADSRNKPETYWASQPGSFDNYDTSVPVSDADAITATPWSEQVDGINWFVPMPLGLVTLTGAGVWQLGAPGSFASSPQALTPANQLAAPQSAVGSSPTLPPIRDNWDIRYWEPDNSTLRELTYQLFFNIYTSADLSWPSTHLLTGHQIVDSAWCRKPYYLQWASRDDGVLLSFTRLKEQEVAGWARHDSQGQFGSLCAVTELPVDALYAVVLRPYKTGSAYFLERMDNRLWRNVEECRCVDAAISLPLPTPNAALAASAAAGNGVIFVASPGIFQPGDVGKVIRMGGGIAVVRGYTGPGQVTGDWLLACAELLPNDPLGQPLPQAPGKWTLTAPVTRVTGLNHLRGRIVTGLIDGVPLDPVAVQKFTDGSWGITPPVPASQVAVGLGFTAQLQSVYAETGQPTIQGRRKAIPAATLRFAGSCRLNAGANQADAAAQWPPPLFASWPNLPKVPDQAATYQSPGGLTVTPLYTGDCRLVIPSDWKKPGQVAVQQTLPLPLSVTALIPEILAGDMPEEGYSPRPRPSSEPKAGAMRRGGA